ncbi:hypothetical protein ASPWEDRAFT_129854 [Aspergillus wentii DTO 134E9]|uniref:BZIP domain-containing protein n=1 Tax=Aspergillus wentii DTO 134E9 TaxID=1073089 RepID=A0A1L9RN14_ASPWE|nr:uncharacterized protein ASPWEDRAFT_129854 [Aspergillus wentii DTO 134E9]KAI9925972.1 hypothetical protein MW887_004431 [Aspergillus wentii]OJJ36304.1 hypothetical protein ASPWEDRAFT_129854 [Aspergillus wentii DTO 134E9]
MADRISAPSDGNRIALSVGCISEPCEVRSAEENWAGLTDPVRRRKLQNRLNQRIYRRRRRAKPPADTQPNTVPTALERSQSPTVTEDQCDDDDQGRMNAPASNEGRETDVFPSELSIRRPGSIHKMSRTEILQIMAQYEASARKDYSLGSPRVDQLLTLIQFTVFRALVENTSMLGFTMDWLDEETISPWYAGVSKTRISFCPTSLRPTSLQQEISHHPWIDLFPIPQMRDNLLQRYGDFDETDLCNDLVDFYDVSNDETGLIVWKDPWHPSGWEVSETFLRKWNWVVKGCDDLAKSTNYWRGIRGEKPLVFDI